MTIRAEQVQGRPLLAYRPDPVLGWALTPNVDLRPDWSPSTVQTIGPDGMRSVPGQTAPPAPNLVFYGCSFTFGEGLRDAETFPALIQHGRADRRVVNRGVPGYSTVQNYLQFRRDVRNGQVAAACFGVFSHHRYRNIAHPVRFRGRQGAQWRTFDHIPVAHLDRRGDVEIAFVPVRQPITNWDDFHAFVPDDHLVDLPTIRLLEAIVTLARGNEIPLVIALLDNEDPPFNDMLLDRFEDVIDVSVPLDADHTFLPYDSHPNARANQLFAERLRPRIDQALDR